MSDEPVVIKHLEDEIAWYSSRSRACKNRYVLGKLTQLIVSAAIPLVVIFYEELAPKVSAALGAVLVVVEGLLQLTRYHENWLSYRATSEALKHEKFLFLAGAGPYAATNNSLQLLAERVESTVSQENATWIAAQKSNTELRKAAE